MESYHGMLACVIAGAGIALMPALHAGEHAGPSSGGGVAAGGKLALAHHLAGVATRGDDPPA